MTFTQEMHRREMPTSRFERLRKQELRFSYLRNVKYTVSPQKTCDYIFYDNFNKCPITIIFGIDTSKSTSHRKMVSFLTSPN